jgi:hypothetical protein
MHKFIRQRAGGAALVGAALFTQAQASTLIDFEGAALAGLYNPGESFSHSGFVMTPGVDFGIVGTVADLGAVAPSGNDTQFYFNSNDGDLLLTRAGGRPFSLDGFSVAFVPLIPERSPPQTIVLVAMGTKTNGDKFGNFFSLGTSTTTRYPFQTYNEPVDFSQYTNLAEVDFFACVLTASDVCQVSPENNGQFVLDDIVVTMAIPEPATTALMALGLLGLALRCCRRSTR